MQAYISIPPQQIIAYAFVSRTRSQLAGSLGIKFSDLRELIQYYGIDEYVNYAFKSQTIEDRLAIVRLACKSRTYTEMAKKMHISRQRVEQIVTKFDIKDEIKYILRVNRRAGRVFG